MRRILKFMVLGLVILLPTVVHARGGREILTDTADGIDIWQKEFNVSDRKPGTYNIIVTAKDAAGNEGVSGPFNIRIDPIAGLPEVSVVYPEPGQVVRTDVNIVGVAQSRFGLKKVLVTIDNGPVRELEGREYWDLQLTAEELGEGKHTVAVRAVDNMDLTGPEFKMDFILDVLPPVIELVSHQVGDLVSGTVKVKGKVTEPLGLKSLELSTDNGRTFGNLRSTAGGKGDPAKYFQFNIPSKKYNDGPVVFFVRATNNTGFSDTKPFLFFVNNYPPQIQIISPEAGEQTWGLTQVTGRVISGVGLTEFFCEWAGQRYDIPLRPGDPFWSMVFPISMANNRAVPFRVTARDKAGNVTVLTQRFQDTRRYRTPTIIIDYPQMSAGGRAQLQADQPIYGHIAPGFFPFAIIMEDQIEYVMAQPSFRIDPDLISVGNSTIRLWAIDEEDVTGQPVTLRVNRAAPAEGSPVTESPILLDTPAFWDDIGDFHIPWCEDSVSFEGTIENYRPGQILQYRLRWDDPWKFIYTTPEGEFAQVIDLSTFEEGPIPIELRTTRAGKPDLPMYFPVNKYVTKPTIKFMTPDQRFGSVQRSTTASGIIDFHVPLVDVSYSFNGVEFVSMDFTTKYGRAWFNGYFDFTSMFKESQSLVIRATDRAGNSVEGSPNFVFDNSTAFPIVILNSPRDGDLITGDFEINGLAYVDVGISAVYYRILSPMNPWDTPEEVYEYRRLDIEFEKIETEQNYAVPVFTSDVRDGENILEIFAEDIYGVQGEITRRTFKISTAPPDVTVDSPRMIDWNRRTVLVTGTAYDRNNLEDIRVSMDNGTSWQMVNFEPDREGVIPWNVSLNTQIYNDGIYSVLIRSRDQYGVPGFSAGIINIDNTPPSIDLGTPHNGDGVGAILRITGQVADDIGVERVFYQLINNNDPNVQVTSDLPDSFVIMQAVNVGTFPDGDYSLKVTAVDRSHNATTIIRNITLIKARAASEVAIVNPMPGIDHFGPVTVSGRVTGAVIPERVTLVLNRRSFTTVEVNRYGIFRYEIPEDYNWTGEPVIFAAAFSTPNGDQIVSYENTVRVSPFGPTLLIDTHMDGDIIARRPWISGKAFIAKSETEDLRATRAEKIASAVTKVELSFDNGLSFVKAKGTDNWRYRLETTELEAGTLPIIIKASFQDGREAVRRILLTVDTRPPTVNTIGPPENSAHRDKVLVYGSVNDDFDMDVVEVSLRPGDKAGYSVPGFIQGLYFDGGVLNGLNYSYGAGLTFFEDNVKVQFSAGLAPPGGRYSGWGYGGKVLANVFNLNMGKVFGPDWEWWKTSLVLGAHFLYFEMEPEMGEVPLWMGQFLGQWEIMKADLGFFFPKWKYFKSISLYAEGGVWLAPTDVQGAAPLILRVGFGGRLSLF